jgi:hypothetical protein
MTGIAIRSKNSLSIGGMVYERAERGMLTVSDVGEASNVQIEEGESPATQAVSGGGVLYRWGLQILHFEHVIRLSGKPRPKRRSRRVSQSCLVSV